MMRSSRDKKSAASILSCVKHFLKIATDGPIPSIAELTCALDCLAIAYHQGADAPFVDSNAEPPKNNHKTLRVTISKRFPEFGYYDVADPEKLASDEKMIGDAIDDLADIVQDLKDVHWIYENVGEDNAIWTFCNLYQIHWGRHLRELTLYLHAHQF